MPVRLAFWDGETFDFAPAPSITITLHSKRPVRVFLTGKMAALGEAYVRGEIDVEGRLQDIIRVGIRIAERVGRSPMLRRLGAMAAHRPQFRHSRQRDARAIGYHYDVSNDFYALWLDRRMIYSCAYFHTGAENIDTAQEQKLDHICRKLRLTEGDRLLDIGCGWGGLLIWAAQNHGLRGVGVTLSRAQAELAQARVAEAGLQDRIEIRLQDYRDIEGAASFDKIVSVGMVEHVGTANLPTYFAAIARLLKPGGLMLNHGITVADRHGRAQGPPGGEFIDNLVFPGGELAHVSRILFEVAGAGLEMLDVEDLRPHYPRTLLHWVRRVQASEAQAIAAAGAERYRIWRMYMAGMAYAFDAGWLGVAQVLAAKPNPDGPAPRPWTRRYQYGPETTAPLAGPLDWGDL
ncbi:MAG: cyclopropane-fatty-acyl-phospholipid synthase family protein [Acetobacteraceae bacterium]